MKIIMTIKSLKREISKIKKKKLIIGFVPTMGSLHNGHLSLVRQAKKETDIVIMSIFVNKLQFGPREDFNRYPRDLKNDTRLAKMVGVDIIFNPHMKEVYPSDFDTFVDMPKLSNRLCGKSRPSHFRGVMTIVTKLFNIIEPNIAYFGQKDYQQVFMIKKLVKDLNMNLKIKVIRTIREKNGLALSSRNQYLNKSQRDNASLIYKTLLKAKKLIINGERDCEKICKMIKSTISMIPQSKIDYVEIINPDTLDLMSEIKRCYLIIMIAVYVDKTRLIDNIFVCG